MRTTSQRREEPSYRNIELADIEMEVDFGNSADLQFLAFNILAELLDEGPNRPLGWCPTSGQTLEDFPVT